MATTEEFAKFIAGMSLEKVPLQVIHDSKELFLDAVACALAGSVWPTGRIITKFTMMNTPWQQDRRRRRLGQSAVSQKVLDRQRAGTYDCAAWPSRHVLILS